MHNVGETTLRNDEPPQGKTQNTEGTGSHRGLGLLYGAEVLAGHFFRFVQAEHSEDGR